jgi:hypothetical protein
MRSEECGFRNGKRKWRGYGTEMGNGETMEGEIYGKRSTIAGEGGATTEKSWREAGAGVIGSDGEEGG